MSDAKVLSACGHSICRCGNRQDMGSMDVEIGGIRVFVRVGHDGIRWPNDVTLPAAVAAKMARTDGTLGFDS
jgi:hypothetical protein